METVWPSTLASVIMVGAPAEGKLLSRGGKSAGVKVGEQRGRGVLALQLLVWHVRGRIRPHLQPKHTPAISKKAKWLL